MKTLTYLFGLTAGFWVVLYVSPLVLMVNNILQHIVGMVDQF